MAWLRPARVSMAMPTTGWGIMMGRSMTLSTRRLPGKVFRARR